MSEVVLTIIAIAGWVKAYMYRTSLKALADYMECNKISYPSKEQLRESLGNVMRRR